MDSPAVLSLAHLPVFLESGASRLIHLEDTPDRCPASGNPQCHCDGTMGRGPAVSETTDRRLRPTPLFKPGPGLPVEFCDCPLVFTFIKATAFTNLLRYIDYKMKDDREPRGPQAS